MPDDRHFFEIQKKILLKNAIASSPPLRDVKDQANQHLTRSRQDLNYDQCSNLILSAATNYYSHFSSSSSQNSIKVFSTEIGETNLSHHSIFEAIEEIEDDAIDDSATKLLASMTNQIPNA